MIDQTNDEQRKKRQRRRIDLEILTILTTTKYYLCFVRWLLKYHIGCNELNIFLDNQT